jgi:hypothetical protein
MASKPRSAIATLIGWVIIALLAFWLLGVVIGTIRFIIRFIVWAVVIGGLIFLYVKLRGDDD